MSYSAVHGDWITLDLDIECFVTPDEAGNDCRAGVSLLYPSIRRLTLTTSIITKRWPVGRVFFD